IVKTKNKKNYKKIKGICYKDDNGETHRTSIRPLLENLDELPLPAWHLYDLSKYKASRISAKGSPVGPVETSRGCVYKCTYCNKSVYGTAFRSKSVKRVVEEYLYLKKSGFKEIHVWDDMFTTDIPRAKAICDELAKIKFDIPWALTCGIRVNNVDQELFFKLKKAGCHAVYFGVESGDQGILNAVQKRIKPEQAKKAIELANNAGLETITFFMLGLPGETKESIENSINFAIEVNPLYAKTTILTPYPGTAIYNEFDNEGLILTKDWSKYNFHAPSKTFNHPNLTWDELDYYYKKFYRKFYFRRKYILKRLKWNLKEKFLFWDIYYAAKTFF
ncbi:MAG: B12-binding domain-containing radical SAM protein, partial [Candidatus Nanoarchaeia archaeon]